MTTLLEGTQSTYIFDNENGLSELENEIIFLKKILKENQYNEKDPKLIRLYKTALRIALARRKWESDPKHSKQSFSGDFILGYRKRRLMRIYFDAGTWFAFPDNYACALHNVLSRIPQKTKNFIEW